MPEATQREFGIHGWVLVDGEKATLSCEAYGDFIRASAGEFTVAKEIYTGLPSGWFSDRSSAYLASGKPVVTQASGFDQWLPTGKGLFSFKTRDEAATALKKIAENYSVHAAAARNIAEQHFDSKKVLTELLATVL